MSQKKVYDAIENIIQAGIKNSVTINFMWLYLKVELNFLVNKVNLLPDCRIPFLVGDSRTKGSGNETNQVKLYK